MLNIFKKLLTLFGDTQWFGWKHPLWFSVSPPGYKLKGEHYRLIKPLLQPGDILLQRFEGWVDKWFIPGFWNHGAIYIGNPEEQVVHATSDGVLIEDIINFMRTDNLIVLRPKNNLSIEIGIKRALSIVGAKYDFDFDFSNNTEFSCTEVIDYCYSKLFKKSKHFGRIMLTPDDIALSPLVETIWDSRIYKTKWSEASQIQSFSAKPKIQIRRVIHKPQTTATTSEQTGGGTDGADGKDGNWTSTIVTKKVTKSLI